MGLERVQANIPPGAQTHVHSDDKHLTQRALKQVASDQQAHYKSDLAEASGLIMKWFAHYGKGLDGGEHVFDDALCLATAALCCREPP